MRELRELVLEIMEGALKAYCDALSVEIPPQGTEGSLKMFQIEAYMKGIFTQAQSARLRHGVKSSVCKLSRAGMEARLVLRAHCDMDLREQRVALCARACVINLLQNSHSN